MFIDVVQLRLKLFDINTYSVNDDIPIPADYKLLD